MTLTIDHTEVTTLLENNITICSACMAVQNKAAEHDLLGTLDAVIRSNELILQAIKSNTGILNQVRERNFPSNDQV